MSNGFLVVMGMAGFISVVLMLCAVAFVSFLKRDLKKTDELIARRKETKISGK